MGHFKKGEVDEYGDVSICVRGHSNAIHELVLPHIVMRLANWEDGDRVEIVRTETYIEPNLGASPHGKTILGLSITKVDDGKLLLKDESELV